LILYIEVFTIDKPQRCIYFFNIVTSWGRLQTGVETCSIAFVIQAVGAINRL
jgi:hypothetical protein